MENLSTALHKDPDFSLSNKVKSLLLKPDFYMASNIHDIRRNAPSIPYPWFKIFAGAYDMPRVFIIINNVEINLRTDNDVGLEFDVHDKSGLMTMFWADGQNTWWFPVTSFEQAQKTQGLEKNDRVYELLILYLIDTRIPIIIDVQKEKDEFKNGRKKHISILDKIKNGLEIQLPLLVPAS